MSVLDVGCGVGAITVGIAQAVAPGCVVGIDRDSVLLSHARDAYSEVDNLRFEERDALRLPFMDEFDVATAARVLQWIHDPGLAISQMAASVKSGGFVVLLDYNHSANAWAPQPPPEFAAGYRAFLEWRASNGWDNQMGDHLAELCAAANLFDVQVFEEDEVVERGDPGFAEHTQIWLRSLESLGPRLVEGAFLHAEALSSAVDVYCEWIESTLLRQTLVLRAVVARKP